MTRISACVIVRDEEKNLPQWLRCVKGIADEIVVVDTGSRDNTVEIARQGGA
ncbi:MAG: glycosyltransferase, partial [Selenomonadaceae bacterium]|nr:glycosyltransferase [Selenomonadaceae bacterium]